jgi:1-acyl-sn-glycerol-3-phosphate acyltransferase
MEQWYYDPAADLDQALMERLRSDPGAPGRLMSGVRALAAVVLRCWLRVYHRLTIVGRDNLPLDRSFVLIANHASHLDTLCLLAALPVRRLHRAFAVAARDYFCVSATRALCAKVFANALPFNRSFAPWQSLGVCSHLLQQPRTILIVFPEGTRGDGPEPGEFKPGVALLAAGRDIPVVPCHLASTHAALPKGAWCPRPKALRLTIGMPRVYADLPATRESANQICHELREAVVLLGHSQPQAKLRGDVRRQPVLPSPLLKA